MALRKGATEGIQAPHVPMTTTLHKPHPVPLPPRLARRRGADEVTSGTLTVTVAPDATCGFNGDGDPVWVCSGGRPCTWEAGEINRFWCGWARLITTCYDSTAYLDPAICNSECRANTRNAGCYVASQPICVELRLGDGILSYGCNTAAIDENFDSTPYMKPRNFNTVVFVDGFSETQWASDLEITTTGATTKSVLTITTLSATEESSYPTETSTFATSSPGRGPNVGPIVGGVVGGLAVIGLLVMGIFGLMLLRRRRDSAATPSELNSGLAPQPEIRSELPDKTQFVGSPTQAGAYGVSTGYPNGPLTSPPPQEAPSPGPVWSYELDGRETDHHHGSMHEMG
ncbi:hypothetical protein FOXYSP1_21019 [Fusarium oxysporum f. sp. phaseoli]